MAMRDYLAEEIALDYSDAILARREALRRLGLLGLTATGAAAAEAYQAVLDWFGTNLR
jgi:carboxymethylenebutenolidase